MAKKKSWFKKAGETGYKLSYEYKSSTGKVKTDYYTFGFKNDAVKQKQIIQNLSHIKKGSCRITPLKLKQAKVRIFPPKKRKKKK